MRTRYLLAPVVLAGAFTLAAPAQENALLKRQGQLQAVAVQKVESSLKEALADAKRLRQAGSNARAAERLRSAVRQLDDPILPRKTVDTWRAQLSEALRAV